jgi:hypothetical protein
MGRSTPWNSWGVRRRPGPPLWAALLLAFALPASSAWGAAGHFRASAPVTISGPVPGLAKCHLNGDDNTPLVAVDPKRARRLLVTYLTGDDRAAVVARSRNGGRAWSRKLVPGLTSCTGGGPGQLVDPGLAATGGGHFVLGEGWVASSPPPLAKDHDAIREYTSRASARGRVSKTPTDIEPTQPDQRSFFATGAAGGLLAETERAPYLAPAGYDYAAPGSIVVVPSVNGGRTWGAPATVASSAPGHSVIADGLMRLPHGGIVGLYSDIDLSGAILPLATGAFGAASGPIEATLVAARSDDGGQTFDPGTNVGQCGNCFLSPMTATAAGVLAVAVADQQADGSTDLKLLSSRDSGLTWKAHQITHVGADIPDLAIAARGRLIGVLATEASGGPGDPVRTVLWTSRGPRHWSHLRLGGPYLRSSITYSHWDTQLGPEQGLVSLPHGFGAAFTTLAPSRLVDGEQDVAFVRVRRRR